MKIQLVVGMGTTLLLAACASTSNSNLTGPVQKPEPTVFTRELRFASVDHIKGANCPKTEKAYSALKWRDIVPLANACAAKRDFTNLEKLAKFMTQKEVGSPWGPYYMSLVAEARGEMERAEWLAHLALKKAPDAGLIYFQLGRLAWNNQSKNEAVVAFEKAVELEPKLTQAYEFLGVLYTREGDWSRAEKYLTKLNDLAPSNTTAALGLVEVYTAKRNYSRASEYLAKSIDLTPSRIDLRLRLAELQEGDLKQSGDALQSYKKIRRLHAEGRIKGLLPSDLEGRIKRLEAEINPQPAKPQAIQAKTLKRDVSMATESKTKKVKK